MKFRYSRASIVAIYFFFTLICMALFINSSEDLRPKPRLNDYLIFPSNDKFKYEILPFLSSKDLIKVYLHFRNLNPALTFENFLPPSQFYNTNIIVLDTRKPIFSQEFESPYTLYQFQDDYSSLQPPILYSKKTKLPKTIAPPIPHGSFCAGLSHTKIIPFKSHHVNSNSELLYLRDDQSSQFLITLKRNNGQFENIACGKVSKDKFSDYVRCVYKAHCLKGWEKNYWKLKYFLSIPGFMYFVKYHLFLQKVQNDLILHINMISDSCKGWLRLKFDPCIRIFSFLNRKLFNVPFVVASLGEFLGVGFLFFKFSMYRPLLSVVYYRTMLPLLIVTSPFKCFIFGLNFSSFCSFSIIEQGLISLHTVLLSQICDKHNTLEDISNSFEIKPDNIMSVVPLLIQNKKTSSGALFCYFFLSILVWELMDKIFFLYPNYWI